MGTARKPRGFPGPKRNPRGWQASCEGGLGTEQVSLPQGLGLRGLVPLLLIGCHRGVKTRDARDG